MENNLTRPITGFNPVDYLEEGTVLSLQPDGSEKTEKVYYLPAWVRQKWYNQYCFENNKIMPLTTRLLKNSDGQVIVEATLSEIVSLGSEQQVIPVQTGHASAFVKPGDTSTLERCETCAKARCLGAAGFSIREEKASMFDEGETPVDGKNINRKNLDVPNETEPKKKPRKRGRPKKSEQSQQDIKSLFESDELLPQVSCDNKNVVDSNIINPDEEHLEKCLKAFFPYGNLKGMQVVDMIDLSAFKNQIDKMSAGNFDNVMVDESLTLNDLVETLHRYLSSPSPEDKKLLIKVVSKIREEDDE